MLLCPTAVRDDKNSNGTQNFFIRFAPIQHSQFYEPDIWPVLAAELSRQRN
jgi:hypothetical protein